MSRAATRVQQVLEAVVDLAGESGKTREYSGGLVAAVRMHLHEQKQISLADQAISNYLKELEDAGYLEFTIGPGRGCLRTAARILKKELATPEIKKEKPNLRLESAPMKYEPEMDGSKKKICILVDYDNTSITAQQNGFSVSFEKLKEFLRKDVRVLYSEVFLSLSSIKRVEVVAMVCDAGFTPILCPMANKDRDSVDAKMINQARRHLELRDCDEVVIVSRDRDFFDLKNIAADMGKTVRLIDILAIRREVEGWNQIASELGLSRKAQRFQDALNFLVNGNDPVESDTIQKVKFLNRVIMTAANKPPNQPMAFRFLQNWIWNRIREEWRSFFQEYDLEAAMTALREKQVLLQHHGAKMVCYEIDTKHVAYQNARFGGRRPVPGNAFRKSS